MEAHSGLSSKIVQEAGFEGIWASGLSISAALGVRDNNEASWTQILEVLEFMVDAVDIPILVDGDTGHGNFNNVRRFIRKLGERGIAGVCIEDKLFPKMNSFVGENQPLADIDEFCGRIKAGARCSLRIEADQRVIVVAGSPVHRYRIEDAVAEAYARAFARSVRTVRRHQWRYARGGMTALGREEG
jgi:phosphoenolpyruvate phosphomutase